MDFLKEVCRPDPSQRWHVLPQFSHSEAPRPKSSDTTQKEASLALATDSFDSTVYLCKGGTYLSVHPHL